MAATQNSLSQRVSEHDVLLAQLSTVVTELHENAKEDRREARAMQTALTLLVERDAASQKWVDSFRSIVFSVVGGVIMYGLVHFFHF